MDNSTIPIPGEPLPPAAPEPKRARGISHLAQIIYRNGFLLAPMVLLLLFPSSLFILGFALIPVFFLTRWVAFGSLFPATRVNWLVLIWLALLALGFAISSARDLAILTAATVLAGIALFSFLIDALAESPGFSRVARSLTLLGVAIALTAPLTAPVSPNPVLGSITQTIYDLYPKVSKTSNPNILAGGIAILAPFALAWGMQKHSRWRAFGWVAFAGMVFAVLILDSRGALFALGAGIALWATLYRRWILPVIPLVLIGLLGINQLLDGPSIADYVIGKVGTSKGGTLIERQAIWTQSILLIQSSPVVGIGLGAFPRLAGISSDNYLVPDNLVANHAHNTVLQIALDTGVLGAVVFITLMGLMTFNAWRTYRAGAERNVAIAFIAAMAILAVHGMSDVVVWGTAKTSIIFWMLLALGISFDKTRQVV